MTAHDTYRTWILGALALGLTLTAPAPAKETDPELAEAFPALVRLAQSRPHQAEQYFEMLTRSHSHDPRPWLGLARLRIKLGATWAAAVPLQRVAELGPARYHRAVRDMQRKAGLEVLPERGVMVELDAFTERAAADACSRRRTTGSASGSCPMTGAPYVPGDVPSCPDHPFDSLAEPDFLISSGIFRAALGRDEAWLTAEAVRRVDSLELTGPVAGNLLATTDSSLRKLLLERLLGAAPVADYDPAVTELARAFAGDPDVEVRVLTWKLLYTAGEVPALDSGDLHTLALYADRGWISKYLVRDVVRTTTDLGVEVLDGLLHAAGSEGKSVALRVLSLDGGREGLRRVARFLERADEVEGRFVTEAVTVLAKATGEDHDLDAAAWQEALAD